MFDCRILEGIPLEFVGVFDGVDSTEDSLTMNRSGVCLSPIYTILSKRDGSAR